jgi:hypothetical protein
MRIIRRRAGLQQDRQQRDAGEKGGFDHGVRSVEVTVCRLDQRPALVIARCRFPVPGSALGGEMQKA